MTDYEKAYEAYQKYILNNWDCSAEEAFMSGFRVGKNSRERSSDKEAIMTIVYLAEVDDGWSLHPFILGASLDIEALRDFILNSYPDATSEYGDYYYFHSGSIRISIETYPLLEKNSENL
jgi:hypothetical protein